MKLFGSVLAACCSCLACGCDGGNRSSVNEPYTAPRPAHPAMTAAAGAGQSGDGGLQPGQSPGELPPGHPPVGVDAAEQIGAPRVPSTREVRTAASTPAQPGLIQKELASLGLSVSTPDGWVEEAPSSPMRLATVRLPRVDGDPADGEISVSKAGGGLEDNINRWRGQFKENPVPVKRKLEAAAGIEVTVVEMEGIFTGGGGPMAAKKAEPAAGTKLWGAIVQAPQSQELIFFKAWGPKRTMERWQQSLNEFVSSLRPSR